MSILFQHWQQFYRPSSSIFEYPILKSHSGPVSCSPCKDSLFSPNLSTLFFLEYFLVYSLSIYHVSSSSNLPHTTFHILNMLWIKRFLLNSLWIIGHPNSDFAQKYIYQILLLALETYLLSGEKWPCVFSLFWWVCSLRSLIIHIDLFCRFLKSFHNFFICIVCICTCVVFLITINTQIVIS